MESFINYLLEFDQLNSQQIAFIRERTSKLNLKSEEYFSKAGKSTSKIGFLQHGVLRYCYYNSKGKEVTTCLIDKPNFLVGFCPGQKGLPSAEYLQAVTDSKLLVIEIHALEQLSSTIVNWDGLLNKVSQKAMHEKKHRMISLTTKEGEEMHNYLKRFPDLKQQLTAKKMSTYFNR